MKVDLSTLEEEAFDAVRDTYVILRKKSDINGLVILKTLLVIAFDAQDDKVSWITPSRFIMNIRDNGGLLLEKIDKIKKRKVKLVYFNRLITDYYGRL